MGEGPLPGGNAGAGDRGKDRGRKGLPLLQKGHHGGGFMVAEKVKESANGGMVTKA